MKEYEIKVTSVDYCVSWEDVDDGGEHSDEWYERKTHKVKSKLPQELELEICCEPENLEDQIADAISEETGWLNNSFTYDVVSEEDAGGHYNEDGYWEDDEEEPSDNDFFENIEIEVKGNKVYLAHDGSSGCEYTFENKGELKQIIADYVADVIDYDYED